MENKIDKAFNRFNQFNILIIGDVMIDAYMWGKVDRISPEAPVPVVSITKWENRLGGAANVGLNIQALDARPVLCAMIGNDDKGSTFKQLLETRKMPSEGIITSESRQTTVKTRIISGNHHLLRVDEESTRALNTEQEQAFIRHIDHLMDNQKFDAIIFEDYDKGNITPNVISFVVTKASSQNIPTLVDPKKRNFDAYQGVTLFKPNYKEICEGVKEDIPKGNFEALDIAAQKLRNRLNAQYIMVTLSELGVYITNNPSYHRVPAQVRDIADVSGAGDTVISVAACCLAAGFNPDEIAGISNLAGGLVCEKVGVVPVNKQQLLSETKKYFAQ